MKSRSTIFDKNVGSIGNMIASQGPDNVIYFRSKNPNPYNPNTTGQQAQRSKFAHIVAIITAGLVLVRDWFTPIKNNHSPYNSAVSAASVSAESEATETVLQYVRNHITWVKGALGTFAGATITNFANTTGSNYSPASAVVGALPYGYPKADYKVHAAAINTGTGEIIDTDEQVADDADSLSLSVPNGYGAQFIVWLENTVNGKFSNQYKVGYKASGGTTVV